MIGPRSIWNEATRIYSTWRSGESRRYCDLYRFFLAWPPWADRGRDDVRELGDLPSTEAAGDSRGSLLPLFGLPEDAADAGNELREFCLSRVESFVEGR